jgi:hypothetical protein
MGNKQYSKLNDLSSAPPLQKILLGHKQRPHRPTVKTDVIISSGIQYRLKGQSVQNFKKPYPPPPPRLDYSFADAKLKMTRNSHTMENLPTFSMKLKASSAWSNLSSTTMAIRTRDSGFILKSIDIFTSIADPDPGSGIRCLFDPLDPGSGIGFFRIPDLGSRIPSPYF